MSRLKEIGDGILSRDNFCYKKKSLLTVSLGQKAEEGYHVLIATGRRLVAAFVEDDFDLFFGDQSFFDHVIQFRFNAFDIFFPVHHFYHNREVV